MVHTLRFALRSLRTSPLFFTVSVASLAIAIGANTAIFSLMDQLLLRMLPVESPEQLVQIAARGGYVGSNWGTDAMSYPMYRDIHERNEVFSGVMSRFGTYVNLGHSRETERVRAELVSGNYFEVLGVGAAAGRTLSDADNQLPDAHPVVMLSFNFWTNRFGSDPAIVGQQIRINGYPMTVVGVVRRGFEGVDIGEAPQVFLPFMMQKAAMPVMHAAYPVESRRSRWVNVFARRKPGVSVDQARAALAPLYKQIIEMEVQQADFLAFNAGRVATERFLASTLEVFEGATGQSRLRRQFSTPLYVLVGLTGLVLMIACGNVANLMIARVAGRQKEIALRLAVGSSRMRIVAQLLIESFIVSASAALLGLALGWILVQQLVAVFAADAQTFMIRPVLDTRVLGFAITLTFLTSIIFGLLPALRSSRPDLAPTLKESASAVVGGFGQVRFRKALVAVQISLSLLLLIASGLFVRTLANLRDIHPGFDTANLVRFSLDPTMSGYSPERTRAFYRQVTEEMRSLPGVVSASYAVMPALGGIEWDSAITVEGYTPGETENMNPYFNAVSSDYLQTMRIPLIAGREFNRGDALGAGKVVIVNEAFVRRYFPDGSAIGRRIGLGRNAKTLDFEIVGVMKDSKYETMREEIPRQVFRAFDQLEMATDVNVYVRTKARPEEAFGAIRESVMRIDSNLPVYSMRTLDDQLDRSLTVERMIASLSAAFGLVATILAVIGLYGVMAYTVTRRLREIGIRLALGAQPGRMLAMVMKETSALVLIGIALALPTYLAVSRLVESQLYGVTANDRVTIVLATVLLASIALLAGVLPANRAARVDPIRVLRSE